MLLLVTGSSGQCQHNGAYTSIPLFDSVENVPQHRPVGSHQTLRRAA